MENKKEVILNALNNDIEEVSSSNDIVNLKVKYLGKKGELTAVLRGMKDLSPEERPVIGNLVNEVKAELEKLIEEKCMDVQALDVLISMEKDLETRTVLMELKNKKMETSSAYSFEDF